MIKSIVILSSFLILCGILLFLGNHNMNEVAPVLIMMGVIILLFFLIKEKSQKYFGFVSLIFMVLGLLSIVYIVIKNILIERSLVNNIILYFSLLAAIMFCVNIYMLLKQRIKNKSQLESKISNEH